MAPIGVFCIHLNHLLLNPFLTRVDTMIMRHPVYVCLTENLISQVSISLSRRPYLIMR